MQLEQMATAATAPGTATLSRSQARALLDRAQRDPIWFCQHVLGGALWERQQDIVRAVWEHPRTAVRSCHASGKSHVAARIALAWLFAWPQAVVLTTAPSFRQVRAVLWEQIRLAYRGARVPLGGTLLQTELHVGDGHFALGLTADDPSAFQGIRGQHTLVIIDEASGLDPVIWQAIDGVLSSEHSRLLSIGNPIEVAGPFRDEFRRPEVKKLHIAAHDTPNVQTGRSVIPGLVTAEWVADKLQRWGESSPLYQSRVLGQFPEASTDSLISLAWVEAAQRRTLEVREQDARTLGVDVARYGDDATVIAERRGPVIVKLSVTNAEDTMMTTGRVVQALRETGANAAYVDVIGIGAGVVDRLREQGLPVVGINVGDRARDPERFANRRAELFWGLRERFESGEIAIPEDEELAAELTAIKYKPTSRGQVQIESKDDMRKRGLHSPDRADAVALAFADAWMVPAFDPAAAVAF